MRVVPATAVIRILCETSTPLASAVVNGLLAWAGLLGGFTAFFSGLPPEVALFVPSRPASLARRINWGLGAGRRLHAWDSLRPLDALCLRH